MSEPARVTIRFELNGEAIELSAPAGRRLLDLVRRDAGLTGTKEGCGAGECGACTVLVDGRPVPSCLVLAASCDGHSVVTVEGLGGSGPEPHPVQAALAAAGGVQCGFCTPGLAVTGTAILERGVVDPDEQARLLSGNLCRCTGYTKVLAALARARESADE